MKKIKLLALFTFLFSALISCENEPIGNGIDLDPGDNGTTQGLFKADFDGQTFSTTSTLVYISGGSIIINAFKPNGENFAMMLDGTTVGNYVANTNLVVYSPPGTEFGYIANHPTDDTVDTGFVTITSINTANSTISGIFQFTGYWSNTDENVAPKEFTNGVFTNLPYVTENPTGDTFDAKINGADFIDTDILVLEIDIEGQDFISIGAENATDDSITVSVRSNLMAGSYPITGNIATDVVQVNFSPALEEFGTPASSGNVTIIEKTATRIKGTFNGMVTIDGTVYSITAGAFDVEY